MYTNKKVLLIEDGEDMIFYWKVLFKKLPEIATVVAKTITEAREALSTATFDLIFLDGNLTVSDFESGPETLPLFLEIQKEYSGKIIFISNYDRYVALMKEYGITHIEKSDVPAFANSYFKQATISREPSKSSYEFKVGNLLVVNVMKNPFFAHLPGYIAEIVSITPLELKIGEEIPIFKPRGYRILDKESKFIQGTLEEQNELLSHYEKHNAEGPLRSGLARFGGTLKDIVCMPEPITNLV